MSAEPVRAELTKIRRELYAKVKTEPPADEPLTPAQQEEVIRLLPISQRVARKVARQWHTPAVELEEVAQEHLIDAVKRFNGLGTIDGFAGQWCRWRLLDHVRHRATVQRIEKPLPDNMELTPRRNRDRRPGDFKRNIGGTFAEAPDDMPLRLRGSYKRDPKSRSALDEVLLHEAAMAVRHNLDSRDVEILRYRLRDWPCTDIAPRVGLSARRVQELWSDIERSIRHHILDTGISFDELGWFVVNETDDIAAEKFLKIFPRSVRGQSILLVPGMKFLGV